MSTHTPERVCKDCGAENYGVNFTPNCAEKKTIDAEGVCFSCAYWRICAAQPHETVIDGRIYSVGDRPSSPRNGMAGRRFDIEYFDGRRVTTYDLWAGGDIPERHKPAIPNTARFIGGAGFIKIGEGGAWNASSDTEPAIAKAGGAS